ncbi:MAG: hypothetical protein ACNYZI_02845 [Anaerolineales bacterium]
MKFIRFLTVAAMLAALFVFADFHAAGIIVLSLNLVFPITVAGLCTTTLLSAL